MEFRTLMAGVEEAVWEPLMHPFLDFGYNVAPAASVEEATEILGRTKLDLLVLDLDALGSSAPGLIGHLRASEPTAKVLALGADPGKEQGIRAAGCDRFLQKPLSREDLAEAMCTLLIEKDSAEVQQILPGLVESGLKEWPEAHVLLLEPELKLARVLMRLLRDPLVAQGVYFVRRTGELEQALTLLLRHRPRPDLVVADLSELSFFGRRPPEVVVRTFLASEIQPRDYIFFTHSGDKNQHPLGSLPGKRWTGNPWSEDSLRTLVQLVGKTALEHRLVAQ